MTLTYCISPDLPASDPAWAYVVQRPETARRSLDGSRVVLKWATGYPPPVLPEGATTYTHAEILAVLAGPEWAPPLPEGLP